MSEFQYVERSLQAYKLESSIDFNEIKDVVSYIESIKRSNPNDALLDVGEATRFLYMSQSGLDYYKGNDLLWIKFGWARRSGLPETLNTATGKTEVLRLPSGMYLYEPSHFLLFKHGDVIVLIYEYNQYAPRPTRLCQYIAGYYRKIKGTPNVKVKMYARRLFTKDVEKLLRDFDTVKSIRIELETSSIKVLKKVLGGSETIIESILRKFGSKTIAITWRSSPRTELEISIDDVLSMFHELENWTKSFVVSVKKSLFGRSQRIDLKKHALVFRKRIRLARDEHGNLLRSTDTYDAINVLKSVIDAVLNQL